VFYRYLQWPLLMGIWRHSWNMFFITIQAPILLVLLTTPLNVWTNDNGAGLEARKHHKNIALLCCIVVALGANQTTTRKSPWKATTSERPRTVETTPRKEITYTPIPRREPRGIHSCRAKNPHPPPRPTHCSRSLPSFQDSIIPLHSRRRRRQKHHQHPHPNHL
jgi:hypothetical protein